MSWLRHWHLWDSNKALIHSGPGRGPRSRQLSQLPRLGSVCTLHLYIPLNIDPCSPSGNRTRPYTKFKSNCFTQKFEFLILDSWANCVLNSWANCPGWDRCVHFTYIYPSISTHVLLVGIEPDPIQKIKSNVFTQKFEFLIFFSESCSLPLGHPESATKIFIGLKLFAVQALASPESNPSLYKNQVKFFWVFWVFE